MSDIQSLIQQVQSNNPDKRYDACEELRVRVLHQPLPQEAIEALNVAVNDVDPNVADAAQRALALHTQIENEQIENNAQATEHPRAITNTVRYWPLIGLLAGLVPSLIWFALTNTSPILYIYFCIGPGGLIGGIIGASIGNRSKTTVWVAAIMISILGAGLLLMFAAFTCAFCY